MKLKCQIALILGAFLFLGLFFHWSLVRDMLLVSEDRKLLLELLDFFRR